MRHLLFLALLAMLQDGVAIKLDPKKKPAAVRIAVEHKETNTSVGEEKSYLEMTTGLIADLELEETKDGARVKLTLRRFYRYNSFDHSVSVDTEKEESSEPARLFKKIIGVALHVKPGASKTSDVGGLTELAVKALKETGLPDEASAEIQRFLGGMILQDVIALVLVHPETPVGVGKTWSREAEGNGLYPVKEQHVWKLKAKEGGRFDLELKSQLKPVPPSKVVGGEQPFVQELGGTLEGQLELDAASGWPLKGSFKRKLQGTYRRLGLKAPVPADVSRVVVTSDYTLRPLEK